MDGPAVRRRRQQRRRIFGAGRIDAVQPVQPLGVEDDGLGRVVDRPNHQLAHRLAAVHGQPLGDCGIADRAQPPGQARVRHPPLAPRSPAARHLQQRVHLGEPGDERFRVAHQLQGPQVALVFQRLVARR